MSHISRLPHSTNYALAALVTLLTSSSLLAYPNPITKKSQAALSSKNTAEKLSVTEASLQEQRERVAKLKEKLAKAKEEKAKLQMIIASARPGAKLQAQIDQDQTQRAAGSRRASLSHPK